MKVPRRIVGFILMLGVGAYLFWSHPQNLWTWMQTVGVCLMAVGFSLWLTAHVQLGSSFAATAVARELVTHGLYSKIRNPIYLFGAIATIGLFLFLGRPWLLLLFVVLIPVQVVRMHNEARVLEAKFGNEYRNYRKGTWF